jgi:hypothetical protein
MQDIRGCTYPALPGFICQALWTDFGLRCPCPQITDHGLQTTDFLPPITDRGLPTTDHWSPTSDHGFPTWSIVVFILHLFPFWVLNE